MNGTCENCGRTQLNMNTITIDGHVAELCVTCAHVLQQNPQRFKSIVRQKCASDSNSEMQKQHQLLNQLMTVGVMGLIVIVGVGFADQLQGIAASTPQYLSFSQLKRF